MKILADFIINFKSLLTVINFYLKINSSIKLVRKNFLYMILFLLYFIKPFISN